MKIFASDYDGTLKVNGEVSVRNQQMLDKWVKSGNIFGLVTGRSVESSVVEIAKYNLPISFLIANNGGVIYDADMQLLKLYEIEFNTAVSIIEKIRTLDCNSFVLNNGYYRAKECVNSNKEDLKYGSFSSIYSVDKILEEKRIAQIIISIDDDTYGQEIAKQLEEEFAGKVHCFPNVGCVDIVPYGVNKQVGLTYIQEKFGYEKESIYCMGDAFNDLSMLSYYKSATLKHAYKEIIEEVGHVEEDVASYLEKLLEE